MKRYQIFGTIGFILLFAVWGGAQEQLYAVLEFHAASQSASVGISSAQKSAIFQDGSTTWTAKGGIVTVQPGLTGMAGKGYILECRLKSGAGERSLWEYRLERKGEKALVGIVSRER